MAVLIYFALGLALLIALQRLRRRGTMDVRCLPSAPKQESHWLYGHDLIINEQEAAVALTRWVNQIGQAFTIKAAFGHGDVVRSVSHRPANCASSDP